MVAVLIFCVAGEEIEVPTECAQGVAEVAFTVPLAFPPQPFLFLSSLGHFYLGTFPKMRGFGLRIMLFMSMQ